MRELKIFSGRANVELAKKICSFLNLPLGNVTLADFPDGEISCKIDEDVRGRDVFLMQPTCPPVNDNLMELLIMIDSCKRASAARVTAVIPYFGYARQDRKDEGRVPITAKLVANLITRAGADRVLDHGPARRPDPGLLRCAGRPPVRRPGAQSSTSCRMGLKPDDIVVVSPDEGSIKRAVGHAKRMAARWQSWTNVARSASRDQAGKHHRRPGRRTKWRLCSTT